MQRFLISCFVVAVVSLPALRAQEPMSEAELTREDVEKSVEYLNAGIKQSKNGKLKKEFKDLLTLLENSDSKEKVDLRAFPSISPSFPIEGQIGRMSDRYKFPENDFGWYAAEYKVSQVISANEMLVAVGSEGYREVGPNQFILKFCVSTKGLVDEKELKDGLPGVFVVTGTETYKTAIGGSNTVWVLKPFDIKKAAELLQQE